MSLQRSSGETETPTTSCTRCGGAMRLKFVAPGYVGGNEEMQTYQCTACGNTEVLKVHLGAQSGRSPDDPMSNSSSGKVRESGFACGFPVNWVSLRSDARRAQVTALCGRSGRSIVSHPHDEYHRPKQPVHHDSANACHFVDRQVDLSPKPAVKSDRLYGSVSLESPICRSESP